MGVITFNGISSRDYHILVELLPDYEVPERVYETVHIPGRNGDVSYDTGAFNNVSRKYSIASVRKDVPFYKMAKSISEWLHSGFGYLRLEDSYEPEYYRLARFKNQVTIGNIYGEAARVEIEFDCKPQRYLKEGEITHKVTPKENDNETSYSITLINNTKFDALPIIKLNASDISNGTLKISNESGYTSTITVYNASSSLIIDSEFEDVYHLDAQGTAINKNGCVKYIENFPLLKPGKNTIRISGDMVTLKHFLSLSVTPNWWLI